MSTDDDRLSIIYEYLAQLNEELYKLAQSSSYHDTDTEDTLDGETT